MAPNHVSLTLLSILLSLTQPYLAAPNPCDASTNFQPPVYSLSDFSYKKEYRPLEQRGAANFTITDIANGNYSINCSNDVPTGYWDAPDDTLWHECHVAASMEKKRGATMAAYRFLHGSGAVQVVWHWVCLSGDRGYPKTYIALVDWKLTSRLDCPNDRDPTVWDGPLVNCTFSSDEKGLTPKAAIWMPATSSALIDIPIRPNTGMVSGSGGGNSTCVERSFMYPGWHLDDYVVHIGGGVGLTLRQASTTYRVGCHMGFPDKKFSCHGDEDWAQNGLIKAPETQLGWDNATRQISVSQSWTCAEGFQGSQPPSFTSSGTFGLPRECTANACATRTFSVPGNLSQPVSLNPTIPPLPPGIQAPNCSAASIAPSWAISNINQTQQKSSSPPILFEFVVRYGILDFDLHNHANNITNHCHIEGEELTNYTGPTTRPDTVRYDKWWTCDQLKPGALPPDDDFPKRNVLSTVIQFDKRVPSLRVNQTWFCQGEGEDYLTSYTATINTTLPLQCHDTTPCYSLVPGSECRPIPYYSSEACSAPTPLSLTAPTSTAAPLPRDPVLVANNSCTIRSSLAPSFAITDWWATTQYGRSWPRNFPDLFENGYYSRVGFSLWNSGLGRTIPVAIKGHEITPYSSPWAGNVTGKWYPCRQYETWEKPDAPVPGTTGCEFMVDLETGYVAFRVGWVCDELDGEHPIHFEATAARYLDLKCSLSPDSPRFWEEGMATCGFGNKGAFLPTTVTWKTPEGKVDDPVAVVDDCGQLKR